jgi:hypothetical protein
MLTNLIRFTICVLFYRIVAIFKYFETVKLGVVTSESCTDYIGLRRRAIK